MLPDPPPGAEDERDKEIEDRLDRYVKNLEWDDEQYGREALDIP